MNPEIQNSSVVRSRNWLPWSLSIFLVGAVSMLAANVPKPASNEPKTHTLFMGADLSVEYNHAMYRVLNVEAGAFIIKVGGNEVRVLADWSKVVTKVDRTLKMTDVNASVTDLKSERSYTMANDPGVKYQRAMAAAELQHSDNLAAQSQANAGVKFNDITMMASRAGGSGPGVSPGVSETDVARFNNQSQLASDKIAGEPGSRFHNIDTTTADEGMFDEMEVRFEISSTQPVKNPYVVFLGQYREKDAKPGVVANWVYAQALQPITEEVKKIHIERGGFPRGFEILDFQVHLYEHGREIATDVAPKRVALTRDEAFTYALMEYVSSHKGASVPANAFMGKLSAETKSRLTSEQLEQPYYVKVSKDGVPLAAFQDTSLSRPVDSALSPLIQNVRFYPALEKGKPVEGVAELKLGRLVL